MKYFIIGLFAIMLTPCFARETSLHYTIDLSAENSSFIINEDSLFIYDGLFVNHDFSLFASGGGAAYKDFSTGRRVGAGFLNILFGLGSFTMGDWKGGFRCLLFDVISIPWFGLSALMLFGGGEWFSFPNYPGSTSGSQSIEIAILRPIWFAIKVVVWSLPYLGIASYPLTYLYKFIRPFNFQKSGAKTALINDPRNWNVVFTPDKNGRINGIISFTAHLN